jgi:hypothetical protein
MKKQVNISNLKTIKNYAVKNNVTPAYIYKMVREGKMKVVNIDGVQFIDISIYPSVILQRK